MAKLPLLVLAMLLPACVSPGATHGTTAAEPLGATLTGTVLDDERRPVEGAHVGVEGHAGTSDPTGAFLVSGIPVGNRRVEVSHDRFEPSSVQVDFREGELVSGDFALRPRPLPMERNATTTYKGQYECAWEFLILGGDCLGLYENLTGSEDPLTKDTYAFRIRIEQGWQEVTLSLAWQGAANNQLEGMRLLLEHGNASKTGHGTQVGAAAGPRSPIELVIRRGETHPTAERYPDTQTLATMSPDGEEMQIRVFPRGRATQYSGQVCAPGCLWGVGVGVGIQFDVTAVVHYADRA